MIVTVEKWFDRWGTRSWVVQRKDAEGNQVGDADYVHTREEAQKLVKQYRKAIGFDKVAAP